MRKMVFRYRFIKQIVSMKVQRAMYLRKVKQRILLSNKCETPQTEAYSKRWARQQSIGWAYQFTKVSILLVYLLRKAMILKNTTALSKFSF
eukprot:UN27065